MNLFYKNVSHSYLYKVFRKLSAKTEEQYLGDFLLLIEQWSEVFLVAQKFLAGIFNGGWLNPSGPGAGLQNTRVR